MIDKKAQTIRSFIKMETLQNNKKSLIYTFACQCGKKYTTYPALYLHFKRTHNIKINTRIQGKSCQTTQTQNERTFTYFYTGVDKQTQDCMDNTLSSEKNLKMVLEEFLNQSQALFCVSPNLPWFICDLYRYIVSFNYQKNQQIISELPNFFNAFAIKSELIILNTKIYSQLCNILLNLGEWLYKKKYTAYTVIMEKAFS